MNKETPNKYRSERRLISGLLLLDKPSGPTSHDLVDVIRRGIGVRRVGHAGTLDPLATGLLVICIGPAARLAEYLLEKPKRYVARIRFGQSTNTYDARGSYTTDYRLASPSREAVERALSRFRGVITQVPPVYSAIKRGGQKAYELARRGEPVEMEPREVEITSLELTKWEPPECVLEISCSAGTYIRSLAHDLGQALKCGAHISGLRRTASGEFEVVDAIKLEDLKRSFMTGEWRKQLRPADSALLDWPEVRLSDEEATRISHGNPVPLGEYIHDWGRAYSPEGDFIAVVHADREANIWKPHKVLTTD